MPSRSLNAAIDLRARRTLGCWPAIVASCSVRGLEHFGVLLGQADAHVQRDLLELAAPASPRSSRSARSAPGGSPRGSAPSGGPAGPSVVVAAHQSSLAPGALGDAEALAVLALDAARASGCLWRRAASRWRCGSDPRARSRRRAGPRCRAAASAGTCGRTCALDHVQPLDVHALLGRLDAQHAPVLPRSLPADHLDAGRRSGSSAWRRLAALRGAGHHSTSGASETIFMKLRSRSSRATGPNTRVPRGLFWSSMITAAFSSKAM